MVKISYRYQRQELKVVWGRAVRRVILQEFEKDRKIDIKRKERKKK